MARAKSELRTVGSSIRMTPEQKNILEKQAKDKGMKFSGYVIHAALHANELSPEIKVKVQDALNLAEQIAKEYAPEKIAEIKEKEAELWSL